MRISRATIYRLIHAGVIPDHRIGGSIRIDPDELRDLLHEATAIPPEDMNT